MTRTYLGLAALLLVVSVGGRAQARINDFTLNRFYKDIETASGAPAPCPTDGVDCTIAVHADNELFKDFAREFGLVMAPKFLAPAETLGQAGFSVGVDASFSTIDNSKEHWKKASPEPGKVPDSMLSTMQVHVRKGLPFSFELGGTMTTLFDSNTIALGGELKWAFNEGFYYLPDIAVRGSVNRLLGSRDLDLLTGGVDVSVSHPFGIGGMVNVTPYAGWSLLFVNASSHVLDATPGLPGFTPPYCLPADGSGIPDGTDQRKPDGQGGYLVSSECQKAARAYETTDYRSNFVLSRQRLTLHRGFVGLGLKITVVSIRGEVMFAEGVNTYSLRLAMNF